MTKENQVCLAFSRDCIVGLGALWLPPWHSASRAGSFCPDWCSRLPMDTPEGAAPFCFRSLNFNTLESVINQVSVSESDTICTVCKTIAGDVGYSGVTSLTQGLLCQAF